MCEIISYFSCQVKIIFLCLPGLFKTALHRNDYSLFKSIIFYTGIACFSDCLRMDEMIWKVGASVGAVGASLLLFRVWMKVDTGPLIVSIVT